MLFRSGPWSIIVPPRLILLSQRKDVLPEDETNIASVYRTIWSISQLKSNIFPSPVGLRHVLNCCCRCPILPRDTSNFQNRLCGERRCDGTKNGRKGPWQTRQAGVDKRSLLIVNLFVDLCPIYLPLS